MKAPLIPILAIMLYSLIFMAWRKMPRPRTYPNPKLKQCTFINRQGILGALIPMISMMMGTAFCISILLTTSLLVE